MRRICVVFTVVAMAACGGGGGGGGATGSFPVTLESVNLHIWDINRGKVRSLPGLATSGGKLSLSARELAATAKVETDEHMAIRYGAITGHTQMGQLAGTFTGTASVTPTDREVNVFLRPPGPRYSLMARAKLFAGRTYVWGFESEPGIVGPDDYWPRVFEHLDRAFTAADGTKYLSVSFDPSRTGSFTVGFGNQNYGAGGYQIRSPNGCKSYILGSNSFFPLDYYLGTRDGVEEVWEPIFTVDDIGTNGTSYQVIHPTPDGFSDEGLALTRDAATRLP